MVPSCGRIGEAGEPVSARYLYALELQSLLQPIGAIQAKAVFDVEGMSPVVSMSEHDGFPVSGNDLDAVRKRIWDQNLATVVIAVHETQATVLPKR